MQNSDGESILVEFSFICTGPLIMIRCSGVITTLNALPALIIYALNVVFHAHFLVTVIGSFKQRRAVGGMALSSFHHLLDLCSEVVKPAILETKALIPLVSKTGSLTAKRGVNGSE